MSNQKNKSEIMKLLEAEPAQYSLYEQLVELKRVANMTGLYDAADWLQRHIDDNDPHA